MSRDFRFITLGLFFRRWLLIVRLILILSAANLLRAWVLCILIRIRILMTVSVCIGENDNTVRSYCRESFKWAFFIAHGISHRIELGHDDQR